MFILALIIGMGLIYVIIIGLTGVAVVANGATAIANNVNEKNKERELAEMRGKGMLISTFNEVDKQEEKFQAWMKQEELKDKYEEFNQSNIAETK